MARINDTTTYPITTPADDDLIIGTDVSNTTNNAGGETVNFTVGSVRGDPFVAPSALNTDLGTGSATAVGTILDVTDLTDVGQLLVYGAVSADAPSGLTSVMSIQVAYSTDNGSTFGAASTVPTATVTSADTPETTNYIYAVALTGSQDAVRFTLAQISGSSPSTTSGDVTVIGLARK